MMTMKGMTTWITRAVVSHMKFYANSVIPEFRAGEEELLVVVSVTDRSTEQVEAIKATYNPLSQTIRVSFAAPFELTGEWLMWFIPVFKRSLRHELEHFRQHKRSGNLMASVLKPHFTIRGQVPGMLEQGPWTSIGAAARYLLNPLEVEAHVVGIKMEARTRRVAFLKVFNEILEVIHWSLLDSEFDRNRCKLLVETVYEVWGFYAFKRYPSLRKFR